MLITIWSIKWRCHCHMVKWLKLVTSGIELVFGFYVILLVAWKLMGGYKIWRHWNAWWDLMYVRQVEPVLPWVLVLGDTHKSGGDWHILHFWLGTKGVASWRLLILTLTMPELLSDYFLLPCLLWVSPGRWMVSKLCCVCARDEALECC
jgi:hypothetical protein